MNIAATLTRCRHGQALVVLNDRPFSGLEVTPQDLRRMAQQLTAIADMASNLTLGGKHWAPTKVEMGNAPVSPVAPAPPVGSGNQDAAEIATRQNHIQSLCLEMLEDRRPTLMTTAVLLVNVQQYYLDANLVEILRALDYLEAIGMLNIVAQPFGRDFGRDQIRLTIKGVNLVEARRVGLAGGMA